LWGKRLKWDLGVDKRKGEKKKTAGGGEGGPGNGGKGEGVCEGGGRGLTRMKGRGRYLKRRSRPIRLWYREKRKGQGGSRGAGGVRRGLVPGLRDGGKRIVRGADRRKCLRRQGRDGEGINRGGGRREGRGEAG